MDAALLLMTAVISLWENQWETWVEDGFVSQKSWQVVANDEYGRRVIHHHAFREVEDAGAFLKQVRESGKTYKDFAASEHWFAIDPIYGSPAYCEWEHGHYDDEEREMIMRLGGPSAQVAMSEMERRGIKG